MSRPVRSSPPGVCYPTRMRLVESRPLSDGRPASNSRSATLIEVEAEADFDQLLTNILETKYYDNAYFSSHSGYKKDAHVAHFWLVAELLRVLGPRRALEVGCGRGDLLALLARGGCEVEGIDLSEDAVRASWPGVRVTLGDFTEVCLRQAAAGKGAFDLLLGLDVWEHLHPRALGPAIEAASAVTSDDALAYFVVPAFGVDRCFGEQFPLEFEENREAFTGRTPFRFLTAERMEPPIPSAGHLVWAHAEWWEAQFTRAGWRRITSLEPLVRAFDPFIPYSVRSSFLFRRDTPAAAKREAALAMDPTLRLKAPLLVARGLALAAREDPEEAVRRWIVPHLGDGLRARYRDVKRRAQAAWRG